jgi:hypothetical protein
MPTRSLAAESHRCLVTFPSRSQVCRGAIVLLLASLMFGGLGRAEFAAHAQTTNGQTRLLRMPTVSATQIAFAYANNIWSVPPVWW